MDLPDILKIMIFKDFLKIKKKQDPRDLSIPLGRIGYPFPMELPDWGLFSIWSNLYVKFSKSRVPRGTDPGHFSAHASNSCKP